MIDKLEPPSRDITSPLRIPISNIFKGQTAGIAAVGRICAGVVQVGERLRALPGDESGIVKSTVVSLSVMRPMTQHAHAHTTF